ncbi:electron transfer flavoprotein subunit beta/FixA family protein [Arthrobacter oryzae]|uniref:electron transfer flavoprotein subunit beta/FixA family protein n=1 Tax=Arthrobacter oryzae TaxID=409290 RepID=UPI0028675A05|nr:electron transfer flavoprotein subunit beta/FixA family protein [Arthrobacter oryzae]MDR6508176.1 electron transfer flavoprotein beta subunit [Arthrobacter oryzae]
MKIAVLIKQVPDTWGERSLDSRTARVRRDGELVIDEINERALEAALAFRDRNKKTEIVSISVGPDAAAEALRKSLAMGADSAVHVIDQALEGADAVATSIALAGAIETVSPDVIIAGNVSTDGRSGVVPAMVAERLGLPLLSALDDLELAYDRASGTRVIDTGTQRLSAPLPALVTITERMPEARFPSFKSILSAKRKPIVRMSLDQLGISIPSAARSVVLGAVERPARTAGRIVVDDGVAAAELAAFLAAERLI